MSFFSHKVLKHSPGPRADESPLAETPWRRDERTERFANPYFAIYEDQAWNRRAGRHFPYGIVSFRNRAVGILPLQADGHVWLVGQHRYATGEFSWELPMGGVPPESTLLDGAMRELKEETGLEAAHWEPLLQRVHLSNSVTDEVGAVFLARGRITDSLTVAGLLAAAARAPDFGIELRLGAAAEMSA